MRKLGAALFAVPVLMAVLLPSLARRWSHSRVLAGVAGSAVIALVAIASLPPAQSAAVPASAPRPVSAGMLNAVVTAHPLREPFRLMFDAPMDAASVAGALRVSPDTAIVVSWDAAGRELTVTPAGYWQPDTLYTIRVDAGVRSTEGGRLERPVRAIVLTAPAGGGTITATGRSGGRIRLDSAFRIVLDRRIGIDAVHDALRTEPAIDGAILPGSTPDEFLFVPASPLAPASQFSVSLVGLVDADGVPFASTPALEVATVAAPTVVRFRPRNGTKHVERGATLSVRFTERMDRTATAAAFTVTANGKPVTGKVSWAEQGRVLVFDPTKSLAYGATVRMTVRADARSRAGALVAAATSGTFKVVPKPKKAPASATRAISRSGGGGAVSGSWTAVERYYLKLMNCTRTGGWVTSSGSCSSPGGRDVAPLALSSGISSKVSRPYAKLLATRGLCDHFIGGSPGDRLRRAGYTSYRWAENLGCRSGNPYDAVLGSHLFFQSEKPYNGGHYRNLMNSAYDRAGIGVWVSSGRVRLVVDFYHP